MLKDFYFEIKIFVVVAGATALVLLAAAVFLLREPAPAEQIVERSDLERREQELVRFAKRDLGKTLNVSEQEVELLAIEQAEWEDLTFGCSYDPDFTYGRVSNTGYKIILGLGNESFQYHAGENQLPFLCYEGIIGLRGFSDLKAEIEQARGELGTMLSADPAAIKVTYLSPAYYQISSTVCPNLALDREDGLMIAYEFDLFYEDTYYRFVGKEEELPLFCRESVKTGLEFSLQEDVQTLRESRFSPVVGWSVFGTHREGDREVVYVRISKIPKVLGGTRDLRVIRKVSFYEGADEVSSSTLIEERPSLFCGVNYPMNEDDFRCYRAVSEVWRTLNARVEVVWPDGSVEIAEKEPIKFIHITE